LTGRGFGNILTSVKRSPLYQLHISLGGYFKEINGWEVPAHYGDPVNEHLYVRKKTGIFDLSHRGKIRISGKDRVSFLQRVLSQDMNKLKPPCGAPATLLDNKGHMLAFMNIYGESDSFLIDCEPGLSKKIIQILDRYLFREDVKMEDITDSMALISIQGPLSGKILSGRFSQDIREMGELEHRDMEIEDIPFKLVRISRTGEEGYDIYVDNGHAEGLYKLLLSEKETPEPPRPTGTDALENLRIEAGIPIYSIDMDEHTIPLEVNLDRAISYDKGCYIGQETIARIKFRGHVNRIFTGFIIDGTTPPERGSKIWDDQKEKEIGWITSSTYSPILHKIIALGFIKREFNREGTRILTTTRDGTPVAGEVTHLPFIR